MVSEEEREDVATPIRGLLCLPVGALTRVTCIIVRNEVSMENPCNRLRPTWWRDWRALFAASDGAHGA
jgi:hypothetical protein